MDKQTISAKLRELFEVHGVAVLFYKFLLDHKATILHVRLLEVFKTTLEDVARLWTVHEEYLVKKQELADATLASRGLQRWTIDRIHSTAKQLIEDFGCLPPQRAIAGNKEYGAFRLYLNRFNTLYEDLRKQYGVPNDLRLIARNGITFRSGAEAAVANFLIVRGFDVQLGQKYPKECGRQWVYDLHFKGCVGAYVESCMDVEIFGGFFAGGQERVDAYEQSKAGKMEFNKNNPNFIHLDADKCWKDEFLTEFFRPYIGDPEVKVFDKIGELVPASMLAVADSTIQECEKLCDHLKVEEIPCRQWFLRTGKFADRKVEDWECAHLANDITKLGGWNKVRMFCKLAQHAENVSASASYQQQV